MANIKTINLTNPCAGITIPAFGEKGRGDAHDGPGLRDSQAGRPGPAGDDDPEGARHAGVCRGRGGQAGEVLRDPVERRAGGRGAPEGRGDRRGGPEQPGHRRLPDRMARRGAGRMRAAVVVFPGSNCDHDTQHVLERVAGAEVRMVWHTERDLADPDLVVLPGGFSYGDYLRTGALARFSPVMVSIRSFAAGGGLVLGI